MNRFFVDKSAVKNSTIEITNNEDIKHISKVLRLRLGDQIEISDSNEFEYQTEITSMDTNIVEVKILDKQRFAREPKLRVSLFQSVPKHTKMEEIIQKTVELGIYEVIPVFSERTVVSENEKFIKKIERWRKISSEAVKQCKRGIIPYVRKSLTFKKMLDALNGYDLVLIPYEDEEELTIKDVLRESANPERVALIIGPEGGFAQSEVKEVSERGGMAVTLGKTILRTETAGPAALAMLMYEFEL